MNDGRHNSTVAVALIALLLAAALLLCVAMRSPLPLGLFAAAFVLHWMYASPSPRRSQGGAMPNGQTHTQRRQRGAHFTAIVVLLLFVSLACITMQSPFPLVALPVAVVAHWMYGGPPRPRGHFCERCGYDLRATPYRCPECGMVPGI